MNLGSRISIGVGLFVAGLFVESVVGDHIRAGLPCQYGTVKTMVTEQDGSTHIVCAAPPPLDELARDVELKACKHEEQARWDELAKCKVEELGKCEADRGNYIWALGMCRSSLDQQCAQCKFVDGK